MQLFETSRPGMTGATMIARTMSPSTTAPRRPLKRLSIGRWTGVALTALVAWVLNAATPTEAVLAEELFNPPPIQDVNQLQCDPQEYAPQVPAGSGCDWVYETGWWSARNNIVPQLVPRASEFTRIPPCACGWYTRFMPCPPCPGSQQTIEVTSTLMWSVTSSTQEQISLGLKSELIDGLTLGFQITETEARQLTGSKVVRVSRMDIYQPILCFNRFSRWTWVETRRTGTAIQEWNFRFRKRCGNVFIPDAEVTTVCNQVVARGTATHNSPRLQELAPTQPPCGGVSVTADDPWAGYRETPCCPDVCTPPPSPGHPCCGCEPNR